MASVDSISTEMVPDWALRRNAGGAGISGPREKRKAIGPQRTQKNAKKRRKGKVQRTSRPGCRLQHFGLCADLQHRDFIGRLKCRRPGSDKARMRWDETGKQAPRVNVGARRE